MIREFSDLVNWRHKRRIFARCPEIDRILTRFDHEIVGGTIPYTQRMVGGRWIDREGQLAGLAGFEEDLLERDQALGRLAGDGDAQVDLDDFGSGDWAGVFDRDFHGDGR